MAVANGICGACVGLGSVSSPAIDEVCTALNTLRALPLAAKKHPDISKPGRLLNARAVFFAFRRKPIEGVMAHR